VGVAEVLSAFTVTWMSDFGSDFFFGGIRTSVGSVGW